MAGRPATLRVDIVADAKGVRRGTAEAESRFGSLGASAARLGKVAGLGLAAVGAAAVGMAAATVGAASEQQQAFGALGSVYGKNARQVRAWAKDAARSVGLSQTAYSNLSALVGSQLTNMGRSQAQAAKQSDALIRTGADLAATFGGSVADAVGAVSSLLKGETDPIERYGVSIKQSDINAKLAAEGLGKLTGAARRQAAATATLELLTKQTSAAHGQFGRETNTLAGQQERLHAQLDNVKASVGSALLPVLTQLAAFANDTLIPGLTRLGSYVQVHLGPTFRQVGAFVTTHVVPALKVLGAFIVDHFIPAVRGYLTPILNGARAAFQAIGEKIKENRPELEKLGHVLLQVADFLGKHVLPILGKVAGFIAGRFGEAIGAIITTIGTFVDVIQGAVDGVQALFGWLQKIADKIPSIHLPSWAHLSAVELVGASPALVGHGPALTGPGGLATAAAGPGLDLTLATRDLQLTSGSPVYVDRRTITIKVDGALDPVAVGRQLAAIMRDHNVRLGFAPAFSAASR